MRFHFFSTAGLTVIRDLVCGFKSSWLWFCSLFFRIQIHDLHSGDHRPDVYASMNCCTEQPSLIRITILPIQPLCLMNFMHQSGRRFAKVFPAYQLLQVHCWGGKWGILKQERLGDLRKKHGDIMGHNILGLTNQSDSIPSPSIPLRLKTHWRHPNCPARWTEPVQGFVIWVI